MTDTTQTTLEQLESYTKLVEVRLMEYKQLTEETQTPPNRNLIDAITSVVTALGDALKLYKGLK